jgi:hypothetical protein
MKTKLISTLLFLACCIEQPAFSYTSISFGVSDCAQWVAESKSNFALKTWLLGFITGIDNAYVTINKTNNDPLKKINSASQIYLWMDNYCSQNPLKNIADGGNALFSELLNK